ncbi:MAG: DUF308 domain-containing protein [Paracoccus sp. (in: a-proteobacteria)]
MKSWAAMMAAGLAALIGGLLALINPIGASIATITLVGWAMLVVAALQGWAAWKSEDTSGRIRAGAIAAGAALLGLILLIGNPGESWLIRLLISLLLLASGAAKIYAARAMPGEENMPLVVGSGCVSVVMGLLVMFGLNLSFGIILGLELLATGLALILLAMHRKNRATAL